MELQRPWIQVSIDTQDVKTGLTHVGHALSIDAEWIEVGTPLLTFAGIESIREIAAAVGDRIVVADFKALDGVEQYFRASASLGAKVATVMAIANEASIRSAIETAHKCGTEVQVDLLNIPVRNIDSTVRRISKMGADYFLLHLGIDELTRNPGADPLDGLDEAVAASPLPVGPVVFSREQGVEAIRRGASYVVIGHPILAGDDPRGQLARFAQSVRSSASGYSAQQATRDN